MNEKISIEEYEALPEEEQIKYRRVVMPVLKHGALFVAEPDAVIHTTETGRTYFEGQDPSIFDSVTSHYKLREEVPA